MKKGKHHKKKEKGKEEGYEKKEEMEQVETPSEGQ